MKPDVGIRVNAKVQWTVTKTAAGNFVAVCEPLGIAMEGSSLDDLYANISEAIQLVLNDLLREGELDQFLKERGWTAVPFPGGSKKNDDGPVAFDVPIELVMDAARDSARTIRQ